MSAHTRYPRLWLLALPLIGLAGCKPEPTVDPVAQAVTFAVIQTEAAEAIFATLTQAFLLTPSATPTPPPTETPQPSLTPVPSATLAPVVFPTAPPTAVYIPPTITLTPTAAPYACVILSQSPAAGEKIPKGLDFDFKVTLRNNGTEKWVAADVDFAYQSGTKLQENLNSRDLSGDVSPGSETTFIIDMIAPKEPGNYSATWAVLNSGSSFCAVNISITVPGSDEEE